MCMAAGSSRRKLKEEVFRRSVSLLRQSEGGVPSLDACVWVSIVFVTSLSLSLFNIWRMLHIDQQISLFHTSPINHQTWHDLFYSIIIHLIIQSASLQAKSNQWGGIAWSSWSSSLITTTTKQEALDQPADGWWLHANASLVAAPRRWQTKTKANQYRAQDVMGTDLSQFRFDLSGRSRLWLKIFSEVAVNWRREMCEQSGFMNVVIRVDAPSHRMRPIP